MAERRDGSDQTEEREKQLVESIVIKIGSSALIDKGRMAVNLSTILHIADEACELYKRGIGVVIVTSGAVRMGQILLGRKDEEIIDEQVEAIYGQPELMDYWVAACQRGGVLAGQVLLTEHDTVIPQQTIPRAMQYGIPIINANDPVDQAEMIIFRASEDKNSADNDKLALHVARDILQADALVLLSDVDGVLDDRGEVIPLFDGQNIGRDLGVGTAAGTGTVDSKIAVAREFVESGGIAVIANAQLVGTRVNLLDFAQRIPIYGTNLGEGFVV